MENPVRLVDEYDQFVMSTDKGSCFSVGTTGHLLYLSNAISGEVGETANQVKKVYRDDNGEILHDRREEILFELGDVLWYATRMANALGSSLSEVLTMNRDKLTARVQKGTLTGKR